MNIGKHIKANRLRLDLTQERLAEKLNVTAQAISKWESGNSFPDITLLPELSAIFGISIDELFETSEETQLNRIEAMLEKEPMLSRADFDYAIARLKELLHKNEHRGRCLTLLADLNMHRADAYASKAAEYAKQALEISPSKKDNHAILFRACRGGMGDWCYSNHSSLIEYYQRFIKKNPDYLPGYMWLLDNLIEDSRFEEAAVVCDKMKSVKNTYHYYVYMAEIARRTGDIAASEAYWKKMLDDYRTDSFAWFVYADQLAKLARYTDAIEAFEKSAALSEKPRFTDALDSIAQIANIIGKTDIAINAYTRILDILREDWNLTEGETVNGYQQNLAKLQG